MSSVVVLAMRHKCLKRFSAIQIGHSVNMEGKDISFSNQFGCKFYFIAFYWKVGKFSFLSSNLLGNIFVITFKFIIIESV